MQSACSKRAKGLVWGDLGQVLIFDDFISFFDPLVCAMCPVASAHELGGV